MLEVVVVGGVEPCVLSNMLGKKDFCHISSSKSFLYEMSYGFVMTSSWCSFSHKSDRKMFLEDSNLKNFNTLIIQFNILDTEKAHVPFLLIQTGHTHRHITLYISIHVQIYCTTVHNL